MAPQTTTRNRTAEWTALVLTDDAAWFAGREHRRGHSYTPPGMLFDPAWLLRQCADLFDREGTVIVPRVPGPYDDGETVLSYPEALRRCIQLAGADGWSATDTAVDNGYGWITFTHPTRPSVHLGILSHIRPESDQLVDVTDGAERIAELLGRYHAATGVAWRATAGVSGVQMIRADYDRLVKTPSGMRKRKQPVWIETTDQELTGAGDIMWRRPGVIGARDLAVVQLDVRMSYGAAAGLAELPTGYLAQTGACEFDPLAAGYWRILVPRHAWWATNKGPRPPLVNPQRISSRRTVCLTTPRLAHLHELSVRPEIIDSVTTDQTARLLRGWYEQLRNARVAAGDDKRLAEAIKSTANAAVGMMHTNRGRIRRRIWADTIIDLAGANLLRKLVAIHGRTGLWPFRVEHDSAWYALPDQDIPALTEAAGVSPLMGRFKIEKCWASVDEYQNEQRAELAARRARAKERKHG